MIIDERYFLFLEPDLMSQSSGAELHRRQIPFSVDHTPPWITDLLFRCHAAKHSSDHPSGCFDPIVHPQDLCDMSVGRHTAVWDVHHDLHNLCFHDSWYNEIMRLLRKAVEVCSLSLFDFRSLVPLRTHLLLSVCIGKPMCFITQLRHEPVCIIIA